MTDRTRWAAFFYIAAVVVALIGEPQPLAILTAGASALTGTILAAQRFTRNP